MSTKTYINARGTVVSVPTSAANETFYDGAPNTPGGVYTFAGDTADDTFYIYATTDQISLPSNHGNDTVVDGAYNSVYTLAAGVQNLVLTGNNQVVTGNGQDDLIVAGNGTATMTGGGGDDVFVDGTGQDIIVDPQGSGSDVIYGFKNGVDHVSLQGSTVFTSFAAVKAALTQVGDDVRLNLGNGQTLTFNDETISAFVPTDFYLPVSTAGLKMTFDDEFNSFNASASGVGTTWTTSYPGGLRTLSSNHEAEYYSDSTVGVNPFSDSIGVLTITAAPTNPASNPLGLPYTSGAITTAASFSQLYGYFEMRAELPSGQGFWPAFWMLPENGTWPPELDVMEQIGSQPTTDVVTAHTNVGGFNTMIGSSVNVPNTSQGFHTYGVYWGPDQVRWYFDGQEVAEIPTPSDMNSPMYMLVNLAVGGAGSWPGQPAPGASAHMLVDYVRAYAYTGTDPAITGVNCFLLGTRITTPSGDVPAERLSEGDMVVTLSGARRVIWIGTGRALATRGRRSEVTPIVVCRGALGDNVPNQDLRITKGHSLYIDEVLIPVEFLVNHRTILWDDHAQEVSVYHIELDTHDVLLANGAPAETYRDDGNRWVFRNANSGWGLRPQRPCAPVLTGGPIVDAVWRKLLDRASPRPGLPLTREPDIHLLSDGMRVGPFACSGEWYTFRLRACPTSVRIASRMGVPQELGLARDPRPLGIGLRHIVIRQGVRSRRVAADDASLTEGFHAFEPDNGLRWTNGDAALPHSLFDGLAGPLEIALQVGGGTSYIDDGIVTTRQAA